MESTMTREYWVELLERIAGPVLNALAEGRLRASMPVEAAPGMTDRGRYTYLEALGRTLAGLAPWLELGPDASAEGQLRRRYGELARAAIRAGVDPASPDYLNFHSGQQPLVDIGFLAQAVLRAPNTLWAALDATTQAQLVEALAASRTRKPGFSNWLMFCATAEAALLRAGAAWDPMRVDYALRQHEQWYAGDGAYNDGPQFHWDYYNSFVIQPMLVDVIRALPDTPDWHEFREPILARARRYAAILERFISPEGTLPPIGRSLAYRSGILQALGQIALLHELPEPLTPGQVRCAMTAAIQRMFQAPETFDAHGWLRIGLSGWQPGLGERYISTGSLYLCTTGFLPLGLPADDPFWSEPDQEWTARRAWAGIDLEADHAI
jgi:hypothetical protein